MNKLTISFLMAMSSAILVPCFLFSQKSPGLGRKATAEATFGNRFDNAMARAVNAFDGGTLCAGTSEAPHAGGTDGLLMKFDREGKQAFQISLDNGGIDAATALCEGPFNRIIIGGNSIPAKQAKGKKYRAAWLMCREPNGDALWQTRLDSSLTADLTVEDVIWVEERREFLCTGTNDGRLWLAAVNEEGKLLRISRFEKEITMEMPSARLHWFAGAAYVYGAVRMGNKKSAAVFIKISGEGRFQKMMTWPDENVGMTGNFIQLPRGKFLATGSVKSGLDRGDVFLLKLDTSMQKENCNFYNAYPDRGEDEGVDIARLGPNLFYIVGQSTSYGAGARTTNFAAWLLRGDGSRADPEGWYFGNPLEETASQVLQKSDGSLWLFGTRQVGGQVGANNDFYLACLEKEPEKDAATPAMGAVQPTRLRATEAGFKSKSGLPVLRSGEKGNLLFTLINEGTEAIEGMTAVSRCTGCSAGINLIDTLPVFTIEAGETKQFPVTLFAGQLAENRENRLEVSFFDQKKQHLQTVTGRFRTEKLKKMGFRAGKGAFAAIDGGKIQKGRPAKFSVEIENTGELDAASLDIKFNAPGRVGYEGDFVFEKAFLGQKERKKFEVTLVPEEGFEGNELLLDAFLTVAGTDSVFRWSFRSPIAEAEVRMVESTRVANPSGGGSIEVSIPKEKTAGGGEGLQLLVFWEDGSAAADRRLTVLNDSFEVKVQAFSAKELRLGDFAVVINGERRGLGGAKFEEEPLRKIGDGQYRFTHKLPVNIGENTISIEVQTASGRAATVPLNVLYKPLDKGTLHVLSIGVPDNGPSGLRFTAKDAEDFAALFQKQGGKLFGEVEITILTKSEDTETRDLEKAIGHFTTLKNQNALTEKDAIVLFVSTHGQEGDDGKFRLRGSDYDGTSSNSTTISYQDIIEKKLDALPCKKFVFLDACHSGALYADAVSSGRKGEDISYSEAMVKLAGADNSIRTMASCGSREYSWEDEKWGNGAFTKVLESVLSNPQLCRELDGGKGKRDGALSMGEIFRYVQKEVNLLVKTDRKESQTPFAPVRVTEEDVPFFSY